MIILATTRIMAENGTYGGYQYSVEHDGITALVEGCPREHSSKNVHERVAYSAMRAYLQNKRETDHDKAKEIMADIEKEKLTEKDLGDVVESAPNMKTKKRAIHAYMKAREIKYGANDKKERLLFLIEEVHTDNEERKE